MLMIHSSILSPDVIKALSSIKTVQEVEEAWTALRGIHAEILNAKASEVLATGLIKMGASVCFDGNYGRVITGTITKVNTVTATVSQDGAGAIGPKWRVSLSKLRPVT